MEVVCHVPSNGDRPKVFLESFLPPIMLSCVCLQHVKAMVFVYEDLEAFGLFSVYAAFQPTVVLCGVHSIL